LILLQHEEQLHSRHDSRLTTAPEPVPASTHSLAPVVSVATFSPGRQKVSYNLKRPRHDTQASRPPACPESPILFCCAAFALGLHCSVLSAQCSVLAARSHLLRCVDTFTEIVNLQPLIVPDPAKPKTGQDRTGRDSGAFSRLLYYSCPKFGFEKKILHPSFFVRAAASPKAVFKLALLPTSSCDPRVSPDLTHAPVSTVEKQSSKSPTLLPLQNPHSRPSQASRRLPSPYR
jgi:hypothetical protein